MNYYIFKYYLSICKRTSTTPTFEGLKEFNKELKSIKVMEGEQ